MSSKISSSAFPAERGGRRGDCFIGGESTVSTSCCSTGQNPRSLESLAKVFARLSNSCFIQQIYEPAAHLQSVQSLSERPPGLEGQKMVRTGSNCVGWSQWQGNVCRQWHRKSGEECCMTRRQWQLAAYPSGYEKTCPSWHKKHSQSSRGELLHYITLH